MTSPCFRKLPSSPLIHAGFVMTGMVTVLLGPVLPFLSAHWSLTDSEAGALFTAQFAGSMLGVAISGKTVPARGYRFSLSLGYGLMSAGIATLMLASWKIGLLSVFCFGVGLGLTIPATNLLVSETNPGRRAAALNLTNLAWGIGAVACPWVVSAFQRTGDPATFLFLLSGLLGIIVLLFIVLPTPVARPTLPETSAINAAVGVPPIRLLITIALSFYLYIGAESSLGGWVASYARRLGPMPDGDWILAPSCFWGMLLLGRAIAPVILRLVSEASLLLVELLLATAGVWILLQVNSIYGVMTGAAVAGLGCAAVFPLTIALLSETIGSSAPKLAAAMFACGSFGGATLPWLVGYSSTRFGNLKAGLAVPLFSYLVLIALHFPHWFSHWHRRRIGARH